MIPPPLYKNYYLDRDSTSIGLFTALNDAFEIKKVLYPGSYIHITPSLVFPEVVYVDVFKKTKAFFDDPSFLAFINANKRYQEEAVVRFHDQDYYKSLLDEEFESFDLLISQYAGFVGRGAKAYLKKGGILICNNSHGDASMAHLDPDYEFIGVYNRRSDETFTLSFKELDQYFLPKKGTTPTVDELLAMKRGVGYTKSPSGYLFRKR